MKILIDASSLKSSGGLSVGLAVMEEVVENIDKFQKVVVLIPDVQKYEDIKHEKVRYVKISNKLHFSLFKIFNSIYVNHFIKSNNIDLVLNLCNIPYKVENAYYIQFLQWAYAVYDDEYINDGVDRKTKLTRSFKKKLFNRGKNLPDKYIVQTNTVKNKLARKIDSSIPIEIAKSKLNLPSPSKIENYFYSGKQDDISRLFYPCRYYTHKNVEILVEAAVLLKEENFPCKIFITIEGSHHKNVKNILDSIKRLEIEDYLINLGTLNPKELKKQYQTSDALIMPTLLETLGLPYLEAMYYNKPILTSDLDFAKEVCGKYAIYFNPQDASDIVKTITKFFTKGQIIHDELERNSKLEDFNKGKKSIISILTKEIK